MTIILLAYRPCVVIVNCWDKFYTLGRAPRTKKTLPDFHEWCRVTQHPRIFHGLTDYQQTPEFWDTTKKMLNLFTILFIYYIKILIVFSFFFITIIKKTNFLEKSFK